MPVNIMKAGEDPVVQEDAAYPDWLLTLADPQPDISDLLGMKDSLTWKKGGKRYFKLKNRDAIKTKNSSIGTF